MFADKFPSLPILNFVATHRGVLLKVVLFLCFVQDIVRINMTSDNKEFAKNEVLAAAAERAKAGNGRLHYLGLVS